MRKALAIINPISGTGSKQRIPELLAAAYQDSEIELLLTYTKRAGHAFELAQRAAAEGYEQVIAVGGDGTVNEVARALVHSQTALGIVPKGSGNGLARAIGMAMNSSKAIEQLATAQATAIDCCSVNEHYFFCTCGMGFDAAVSHSFAEAGTRGPMTYLKTMIEEYQSFKPQRYEVTLSSGEQLDTEAFVLVAANASQYGNNAYIAPTADLRDGLIDLAIIRPFPTLEAALVLGDLFRGKLPDNKYYSSQPTEQLLIRRTSAGPVHIDGEPIELGAELQVQLHRSALRVLLPV